MIVYKSMYNALSTPSIFDKTIIIPSTQTQIKFIIYVIPSKTSIYKALKDDKYFSRLSMNISESYIYIVCNSELSIEILSDVEKFIFDNISNTKKTIDLVSVKIHSRIPFIKDAINLYNNITLFLPTHTNNEITYNNYKNDKYNTIHENDTIVSYKNLLTRREFSPVCGRVMNDGSVNIFNLYPLKNANITYVIPEHFYIYGESCNKIASYNYNGFIFWLVTDHTFVNNNDVRQPITSTEICIKSQPFSEIHKLIKIFITHGFYKYRIHNSSISAEDKTYSILMFVGIYDLSIANKYTKYFDLLLNNN